MCCRVLPELLVLDDVVVQRRGFECAKCRVSADADTPPSTPTPLRRYRLRLCHQRRATRLLHRRLPSSNPSSLLQRPLRQRSSH